MRNKGFFWTLTIVLVIVSIYQLSFSIVGSNVEKKVTKIAEAKVDTLRAHAGNDSVKLPNGTYVNFKTNNEAYDLAKSAYVNHMLKEKNDKKVFLGNTYEDVKGKSIALGLDLQGGMSVTLQISTSKFLKNEALNSGDLHFSKPYERALKEYNEKGGDFISIFAKEHKKLFPNRLLVREFLTREVATKIGRKASDEKTISYLNGLLNGALSGVETIMKNRINQFGVADPHITKDKTSNRLYIELPGVKDQATVRSRLQSTANLEFYLAFKSQELGGFLNEVLSDKSNKKNDDLFNDKSDSLSKKNKGDSTKTKTASKKDTSSLDALLGDNDNNDTSSLENALKSDDKADTKKKKSSFVDIFQPNIDKDGHFVNSPVLGYAKAKDTSKIDDVLYAQAAKDLMDNIKFVWGSAPLKSSNKDTLYYKLFALKVPDNGKARVGGTDIVNARVSFDPNTAERGVSVEMNDHGSEEWGQMTTENVGNFIAITMDNKVFSAPVINGPITGGNTLISGNFTVNEAQALTNLLKAGSLPAPAVIVNEAVIGPSIGAQNAKTGFLSFAFALVLVLIYMVFYYGKAGLIADFGLIVNIVILLGFLAAFGAVLTLAGVAGLVLTMGMSVDANVLIYERAREEIKEGKGMKMVIKDGYKNALSTILDSNITTLLTAIVLAIFGTGPIESFAITLIIGIFTSVFTAVIVTRLVFEYYLKRKKEFTFSTKPTKHFLENVNFGFVKNRKKAYIISGIVILVGIIALSTKGLKPSVEFTGGKTYEVVFTKPVAKQIEDIKDLLHDKLVYNGVHASSGVKTVNSDYRIEVSTDYLKGIPNTETKAHDDLLAAFKTQQKKLGVASITNSRSISPTISDELKSSSAISITLSLIAIFIYILIRFGKWQYSFGATLALAHDVFITIGLFALLHGILPFNMEIDQAFIAALLTIMGYSINDTVVVFDRVREFTHLRPKKDLKTNINDAINSTLGRTINTSMTVFIVLLTILIFDGGSIKGFIFALLIGVVVGTYSSIFVATTVALDLMNVGKKKKTKSIE